MIRRWIERRSCLDILWLFPWWWLCCITARIARWWERRTGE